MYAMTALQAPQAFLVCQVLKGTRVSRESQGEKAQKGKREMLGPGASQGLQESLDHREVKESVVQLGKLDRKVTRVILEFLVSWDPPGTLGHGERMALLGPLDLQGSKGRRGKKVLLAPKAHLGYPESREKKAKRAEVENQVPPGSRAKLETRVYQDQREPVACPASRDTQATLVHRVPGESLVPWGPLAGKGRQEKMVTLDPQGHRVPQD